MGRGIFPDGGRELGIEAWELKMRTRIWEELEIERKDEWRGEKK